MATTFEVLGQIGVVPVMTIDRAQDAVPLARTLLDSGIGCLEVTFRTPSAEEAIRRIGSECREVLLGAGTILAVRQAERAVRAGARFIVSPGFDPSVVDWCQRHDVPVLPGVATPTEITRGGSETLAGCISLILLDSRLGSSSGDLAIGMGWKGNDDAA